MRCPACGSENRPGARFCNGCGAALASACAACGQANPPSSRFCDACGQPLTASQRPSESPPGPVPTSPLSYTPPHLAEQILAGRAQHEGERKQVTILFADLTGSTALIQDLDPEEARALLEPAVRAMLSAVHRFEGTVCRVMGDGIMALFGAPIAHEDHAARACYAALTMQQAIREYGERVRARDGIHILARVGLNSGEVVVGSISNDLHVEYSAIGASTHLAARMEQLAVPGTIQLTAETLRLAEGLIEVRSLGQIPVRGISAPIEAFELTGAGVARRRFQAAATRGLTPFVGRDAELGALQRALDLAREGHGQVVAPVGDPGVGKSRLFYEFIHSHRTAGWLVLESGSVSYGKATSYLPVIDLLKGYCRIEPHDDARAIREKVTGKLLALDQALSAILTPLLALLDVPVQDLSASSGQAAWDALDPLQRRAATLDALRRLLLRESQEQPLVLVFEDLHWIDAETQALLDALVDVLPTTRILLLVNYRPEYTHTWGNRSYYTQLRIDPLGQASAAELLDVLLGEDASVRPLKAPLIARTDGNPFFLEESVRTLVETGALVGERGAYRLSRTVAEARVPSTVQNVLAARIDRLPPAEKRLLQTAAVIGKDVSFDLLEGIAETSDATLRGALTRLQAAELLYPVSLFPSLELTFKHALTHEVAYGSLLQERRRALHGQIVGTIERLYAERLEEQVERLAHHALAGEVWPRALQYCDQAGDRLMARAAYREAAHSYERALGALDHLDRTPEQQHLAVDARMKARNAWTALGDWRAGMPHLIEAERLTEELGDRRRMAALSILIASTTINLGEPERALAATERALSIAQEVGDFGLRVASTWMLGSVKNFAAEYQQAAALHRRNLASLPDDLRHQFFGQVGLPSVTIRSNLAWSLAELGGFEEAARLVDEGVEIAEAADHAYSLAAIYAEAGYAPLHQGDLPRAIRLLEYAVDISERSQNRAYGAIAAARLGHAYALEGRFEEALTQLQWAVDQFAASGHRGQQVPGLTFLAHTRLLMGQPEEARQLGEEALDIARTYKQPGRAGHALRILGEIALDGEPPDLAEAETRFRESLTLADRHEMRPLRAHCHLGLGKLYRRTDRPDVARSELQAAVALLRELGMTRWLPEAEDELTRVGG